MICELLLVTATQLIGPRHPDLQGKHVATYHMSHGVCVEKVVKLGRTRLSNEILWWRRAPNPEDCLKESAFSKWITTNVIADDPDDIARMR